MSRMCTGAWAPPGLKLCQINDKKHKKPETWLTGKTWSNFTLYNV